MKKILAAILALCMLGMLLAGCGNTSSAAFTASASAPQTEDSALEKNSDLFGSKRSACRRFCRGRIVRGACRPQLYAAHL